VLVEKYGRRDTAGKYKAIHTGVALEQSGNSWFVERSGKREGPVDQREIGRLLIAGEIAATSLIWRKGMDGWKPILQVDEFREALQEVPPSLPDASLDDRGADVGVTLSAVPRPWVRFFARKVDYLLFGLFLAVAAGFLGLHPFHKNELVFAMSTVLLWIPVEAVLLTTWGYTPGKALLRVRVRKGLRDLPSFDDSFRRSLRVWWRGEGTGFPLFFLFTGGWAHGNFKIIGTTSWDREHLGDVPAGERQVGQTRDGVVTSD
jgi:uncharacterized RDD family membrane protein YckC